MMPGLDGFGVLRALRGGGSRTPVLFLTARDAGEDKVAGLTLGGDDYITKPFSLEEVVARIRAVLRRTGSGDGAGARASRLSFADVELDEDSHEVFKAGRPVSAVADGVQAAPLLPAEPGPGAVQGADPGPRLAVRLRRRRERRRVLRQLPAQEGRHHRPRLLHTLRGVGYVLRLPP
jgi:two-component system OmpR family response regulator